MSLHLPASLRLTVPLILLGFAATLSMINVLYHVPRAERAAEEDVVKRVAQEMSRLQSTLEYLLLKDDLEVAQHEIAVLAHNHDYVDVALTNDRRKVLAATRRECLGQEITMVLPRFDTELSAAAIRERRVILTVDPSGTLVLGHAGVLMGRALDELRPSRSGNLFVAYDLNRPKAQARAQVLRQSLYWAGWVTALALAMWLAFHFLLTRRTAQLVRAAEQLAAGNLAARSALRGNDELGRLSRAFDAMAGEVADTQNRLREDIAERERAEAALRVSEASYRAIFDAMEDAIFVLDVDKARIVDLNPKAGTAYGYAPDEMRQMNMLTLSSGEPSYTREDARALITRAIAGEQLRFEWQLRHKDGNVHWHEVFVKRVTIGGEPRMLALTREVTDRKLAEQALRASEEQYRSMFSASIDGLALWNAEGEIVDTNPALWQMYGYAGNERALPSATGVGPNYDAHFLQTVAGGESVHVEVTELRKDGSVLELEVHGVPMLYQGKPHVLTIARDITDKKRAAQELTRQREALYQREKLAALGALLAGVAHELNNPLSVVVARAVMLEEQGDPATHDTALKIRTAADRCARIVRTYLAMARHQQPARGPVAINEVIGAALDITAYTVRSSNIEVTLDLGENIPLFLADADQLHQVLMNLIVNAQQVLQDQPGERRIRVHSGFDAAAGAIRITVADNGPGIPEYLRARVFEPFFTTKPVGFGTGIGLAVSFGIVEAHGGTLAVDCPAAGGTVFSITLPAVSADVANADLTQPAPKAAKPLRVLVVDDEAPVRDMLGEILREAGHRVVTAVSGREALVRLEFTPYDVILTDIRMPELDGRALYREIETRWPERAARVVFVTGDTLSATSRNIAAESGCPVVEKPFLPSEVRRVVAQVAMQAEADAQH